MTDQRDVITQTPFEKLVGAVGVEPTRLSAQEPKSCVYANFTTRPNVVLTTVAHNGFYTLNEGDISRLHLRSASQNPVKSVSMKNVPYTDAERAFRQPQ